MTAYISEISYAGTNASDLIEIAVPAGTDVSAYTVSLYSNVGNATHTFSLGSVVTTMQGMDVYVIDQATTPGFSGINQTSGVALSDGTGGALKFVSFAGNSFAARDGPAAGTQSTSIGTVASGNSLKTSNDGSSYQTQSSPNQGTIPCYASGTLIDTPDGPCPVETLKPGDPVSTRGCIAQDILWIRCRDQVA